MEGEREEETGGELVCEDLIDYKKNSIRSVYIPPVHTATKLMRTL